MVMLTREEEAGKVTKRGDLGLGTSHARWVVLNWLPGNRYSRVELHASDFDTAIERRFRGCYKTDVFSYNPLRLMDASFKIKLRWNLCLDQWCTYVYFQDNLRILTLKEDWPSYKRFHGKIS